MHMSRETRYKVRGEDIRRAGIDDGPLMGVAIRCVQRAMKTVDKTEALGQLAAAAANPGTIADDSAFLPVREFYEEQERNRPVPFIERDELASFANFCPDVDENTFKQMENVRRLPVATRTALMPDGHYGYGLSVGGVLETENSVVPFAVGVDIACRLKLSILDLDVEMFEIKSSLLEPALLKETMFGTGANLPRPADHAVLDDHEGAGNPASTQSACH